MLGEKNLLVLFSKMGFNACKCQKQIAKRLLCHCKCLPSSPSFLRRLWLTFQVHFLPSHYISYVPGIFLISSISSQYHSGVTLSQCCHRERILPSWICMHSLESYSTVETDISFIKWLLSACCVPGAVLDSGSTAAGKTAPKGLSSSGGSQRWN